MKDRVIECYPSPKCGCCVCRGVHCLIYHPGHDHRILDDNEDKDMIIRKLFGDDEYDGNDWF